MTIGKTNIISALLCLLTYICFSQTVKGIILDAKTNVPIESASVYFDNTSIGTSSNLKGEFEITLKKGINTALIISFLGYEKVVIKDYRSISSIKSYLLRIIMP